MVDSDYYQSMFSTIWILTCFYQQYIIFDMLLKCRYLAIHGYISQLRTKDAECHRQSLRKKNFCGYETGQRI